LTESSEGKKSVQIGTKPMLRKGKFVEAVAYMRTSTSTNVGEGKDSEKRQRAAIDAYAKGAGYAIGPTGWFYDAAVKGADPVTNRPGFASMMDRIAGNGVRTIIVESPDRFARDLAVQLAGHDYLKNLGVALIPASAPDFFLEDTPTAVLVRQVLGAIAQFEKATLVAKLRGTRERKKVRTGKAEGRKSYAEANPQLVELAHELSEQRPRLSLRDISAALASQGFKTPRGIPYSASAVASMLGQ
jgi:DNA invertase Pin-like site-specific DNA recombinase